MMVVFFNIVLLDFINFICVYYGMWLEYWSFKMVIKEEICSFVYFRFESESLR